MWIWSCNRVTYVQHMNQLLFEAWAFLLIIFLPISSEFRFMLITTSWIQSSSCDASAHWLLCPERQCPSRQSHVQEKGWCHHSLRGCHGQGPRTSGGAPTHTSPLPLVCLHPCCQLPRVIGEGHGDGMQ